MNPAFWKNKTLEQLDEAEWEALCDGCGKCCMVKFRNQETGALFQTDLACQLLDRETIRCTDYANRNHHTLYGSFRKAVTKHQGKNPVDGRWWKDYLLWMKIFIHNRNPRESKG